MASNAPVSVELSAPVEEVRRARTRRGGPKNWDRVDLLGGLLKCFCGRQLRNDGTWQWRARQVAAQRRKAGLTQVQVAGRLGRPQAFVTKYERGERRLDVIELVEVAAAIGADPVDLVGELARRRGVAES